MVRLIRIEIFVNESYTERERAILHTMLLNISSLSNALVTGEKLTLHPVPMSKADLSVELAFKQAIEDHLAQELASRIERVITNSFKMSKLQEPAIDIKARVDKR
ncbi:hypothetical protein [Bacillus sp. JCM 19041]|uniref:hypothetical protein n=1 Tax=Bacillus sp. JCM 19041 TaxID=1460637 RepID=UPI0006D19303